MAMMERLGHSSVTVTPDRYGHLFPSLDETLIEGLENTHREAAADFLRSHRGPEVVEFGGSQPR